MAISLQAVLAETIRKQATDIHLGTGLHPTVRIDGDLLALTSYGILNAEDVRSMTGEVLTRKQIEELEEKLEMDFSFTFTAPTGESSRFRGNCFFERGNPGMALRTIPTKIRTIAELKLPPRLEEVTKKHRGLFLVTGPTGSGKSTTLASLIQEINHTRACHIVTIEDPIEYLHTSVMALIYGLVVSRALRAERRELQSDIDRMMVQTGKLGAELKKEQARYQDFGKALALLQKELPSVEFLGSLERTLPPGVWLQKASLSPGKAALSGFAYTENDVVSFGRALSEAVVVSSVGFPVTTRVRQESGASVRFSLDCGIRDIMSIAADASEEGGGGHGEVASR